MIETGKSIDFYVQGSTGCCQTCIKVKLTGVAVQFFMLHNRYGKAGNNRYNIFFESGSVFVTLERSSCASILKAFLKNPPTLTLPCRSSNHFLSIWSIPWARTDIHPFRGMCTTLSPMP